MVIWTIILLIISYKCELLFCYRNAIFVKNNSKWAFEGIHQVSGTCIHLYAEERNFSKRIFDKLSRRCMGFLRLVEGLKSLTSLTRLPLQQTLDFEQVE